MSSVRGLPWSLGLLAGIAGALGAALAWRRLDVVEVRGRSMAPTLLPGDRLLVARLRRPPRAGDVVLAADPRDAGRELIKRVGAVHDGHVVVHGDAPDASTDSRHFGELAAPDVRWRVVGRYWPPARAGTVAKAPPRPLDPLDEGGEPACTFPEALIAGD
ncbi:MAG TPA: S26 family signal peptidase [Candidatus Limnocylindria bacterium]|nr:S26 family signal peptidase [Candidatus Limnocylindria bacterium]